MSPLPARASPANSAASLFLAKLAGVGFGSSAAAAATAASAAATAAATAAAAAAPAAASATPSPGSSQREGASLLRGYPEHDDSAQEQQQQQWQQHVQDRASHELTDLLGIELTPRLDGAEQVRHREGRWTSRVALSV